MELEERLSSFFTSWYRLRGRDFPWRRPGVSPFGVLLAEMLLRQTTAEAVARVWPPLVSDYPAPVALAGAVEADLYERLAPLGLGRQRVSALLSVSQALLERHDGVVPTGVEALLALPHAGLYTAHAVACFAFDERLPVVDVNVLRVFSRLTGQQLPRDNRRPGVAPAWALARVILPAGAREHNYGLLDFSAQVCKPRGPLCSACPLLAACAVRAGT